MQFSSSFRWYDTVLLTLAVLFSISTTATMLLAPKQASSGVAVIFAPWTNAQDVLSRAGEAGSRFVRFGAFDFIAVVQPETERFAQNVRAQGAWFIADPAALAACLKPLAGNKV